MTFHRQVVRSFQVPSTPGHLRLAAQLPPCRLRAHARHTSEAKAFSWSPSCLFFSSLQDFAFTSTVSCATGRPTNGRGDLGDVPPG